MERVDHEGCSAPEVQSSNSLNADAMQMLCRCFQKCFQKIVLSHWMCTKYGRSTLEWKSCRDDLHALDRIAVLERQAAGSVLQKAMGIFDEAMSADVGRCRQLSAAVGSVESKSLSRSELRRQSCGNVCMEIVGRLVEALECPKHLRT